MATAKQILDIAAHEVGMKENPPNSNMTPYGKEDGVEIAWKKGILDRLVALEGGN